ncbi:hypothetical protein UFOVP623_8 [uncultured Caudovirales phage]|uniref:Uncharacterized protein n=1 Tax=uncultured Caudovirales phage TaxID=2100421 RepID=A0A6J5N851_9CAUD|nr:hypothetical protein UFOVP623_8 [uncultured Caudovirales phage]
MIIIFPNDINTIEGAVNYVETSNTEEYAKFKNYFYSSDHAPDYEIAVLDAIHTRDQANV